ncbi:MAG TPA: tetratricopeptide repeat protein, partial [Vicinamibacteria bacterium]|nr:tetratricopeptide repeat protein [Vicinamibacteria bacterium]
VFSLLAAHLVRRARPGGSFRIGIALLAAAFFALHPMRVESVAWATERRDVLGSCFFLLAVFCHLRWNETGQRRWYGAGLGVFVLCLLSKALVVLPAVLLILDAYLPRRGADRQGWAFWRRSLLEKTPFFALAAAFSALALRAQAHSGALVSMADHGVLARAAQAGYGLVFYVRATWFTLSWYPLYERPVPLDPLAPAFALSLVAACALTAVLVGLRRRLPSLLAVWACYVVLLLPVLGISQSGVQLVADRYSYLAGLGPALLVAVLIGRLWASSSALLSRATCAVATAVVLIGWTGLSRRQLGVWRNDETLWRHVLTGGPSALAHHNLGNLLAQRGDLVAAVSELTEALRVAPSYPRPWSTLKPILEQTGGRLEKPQLDDLVPVLERALVHHQGSEIAHYTLGLALTQARDDRAAVRCFERALILAPGHQGATWARSMAKERLRGPEPDPRTR